MRWVEVGRSNHVAPVMRGIQESRGDIVAVLDDDVVPETGWASGAVGTVPGSDRRVCWRRRVVTRLRRDIAAYAPGTSTSEYRALLGSRADQPRGLFIGSGRLMKGEDVTFEVMSRTPEVGWLALGGAPLGPLPQEVSHLDGRDPAAMSAPSRATDVLLVTSEYESFGTVAAEAMACGTCIVRADGPTDKRMCPSALPTAYVSSSRHAVPFVAADRAINDLDGARTRAYEFGRRPVVSSSRYGFGKAQVNGILYDVLGSN